MKQIAVRLGVSPASVHRWTRDIEVSEEHRMRNLRVGRERFAERWSQLNRERRAAYQLAGRRQARQGDPLHLAGCMLYWAEGSKERGVLTFVNSDRAMVAFFWRFLRRFFALDHERLIVRLNVYLGNGLTLHEIERTRIDALRVPPTCLGHHAINHFPTSSSGRKTNKLPYGVCSLRLYDTCIVQHIFGAIQEYGGFVEERWLDGPPRKPRSHRASP